jgi:hypothetical protein
MGAECSCSHGEECAHRPDHHEQYRRFFHFSRFLLSKNTRDVAGAHCSMSVQSIGGIAAGYVTVFPDNDGFSDT